MFGNPTVPVPELPDIEAARRALQAICVGRSIRRCTVARDSVVISGVFPWRLESALVGRSILEAKRKGKNLWLRLDEPPFPSFQFGVAGAIYIEGVPVPTYKRSAVLPADEWPSKHSKVFVELDDGVEFSFTDERRFARIRFLDDPESMPPISELGPDALFEPMQSHDFIDSLGQKKTRIKALLLNQSFISGIGNWIADEVLYQARIHPLQIAANLSKEDCELLHRSINEVIRHAVDVDADPSRFPSDWLFHVKRGKKPGYFNGKKKMSQNSNSGSYESVSGVANNLCQNCNKLAVVIRVSGTKKNAGRWFYICTNCNQWHGWCK